MTGTTTAIAAVRPEGVTIRGLGLVDDIIGRLTFTEMTNFLCSGALPTPAQTLVLDACLVKLMEHGWTPSSIIARMMADSVPEDSQVAIAAGLLSLGPIYAGTSEACARLLQAGVAASAPRPCATSGTAARPSPASVIRCTSRTIPALLA